jgi:predicted nucleic-acid-binding protein
MGGQAMKITPDTNILVRAVLRDDKQQNRVAQTTLAEAEAVALTLPALCEFVWVLSRGYKVLSSEIAKSIRQLVNSKSAFVNRPAVEAGLALLEAGGDFADGVIAYEGKWLGAETFVSFDRKAVNLLQARGEQALNL